MTGGQRPRAAGRPPAAAASARSLLFTVLGEFVLPSAGAAWTSAFIDVFARLGVAEKTIRQALMRAGTDGWLKAERSGRRTAWRLTPDAERLLTEGTERIYNFAPVSRDWDGRWLLVLARVPETERPARYRLRTQLTWAGLGSPAPGVWISTRADRISDVGEILAGAGQLPDAHVFTARHQVGGELAALVSQAWDIGVLERQYRAFASEFSADADDAAGRDPLGRTVELVHAWRRFPWIDPALPPSLLPAPWAGEQAAELFSRLHARWSAEATAEWRCLNEAATAR